MKGRFKILGHIGVALFLASALMLAFMPAAPVQAATAVEDVWVEFPTEDADGNADTDYNIAAAVGLYRIHFKATHALTAGVDTITVQFPDGEDSDMGPVVSGAQDTYDFELGASCDTATNYRIDPDGPGTTYSTGYTKGYIDWGVKAASYGGYRITVTTKVGIPAGNEVWLLIDSETGMVIGGAANDSGNHTAAYKVKVWTSQDTTPVLSKGFYLGATGAGEQVATTSVTVSPDSAGAENAMYTFTFTPSTILQSADGDTITVTFPYGTTLPSSISASSVSVYDGATEYTCGTAPIIDTDLRTVKVTVPHDLTQDQADKVKFASTAGITNPTKEYDSWGDAATASRAGFIRTNEEPRNALCDASGYSITDSTASTLDFDYSSTTNYSDKYTMVNMYSNKLYLQVEDEYGNLVESGDTATAVVTLTSTSTSGSFYYYDSGYQLISPTVSLGSGAKEVYYKDTAAGTYTLTASYSGLDDATWTMTVAPAVSVYDKYDNLITTYGPTSTNLAEEVSNSGSIDDHTAEYYINQALTAACAFDKVVLGDGVYEAPNGFSPTIANYVTLKSVNGADKTTIEAKGTEAQSNIFLTANYFTVGEEGAGITFQVSRNAVGTEMIDLIGTGTTFQYCVFDITTDVNSTNPVDNAIRFNANPVTNCTISNNTFYLNAPCDLGLMYNGSFEVPGLTVSNNTFNVVGVSDYDITGIKIVPDMNTYKTTISGNTFNEGVGRGIVLYTMDWVALADGTAGHTSKKLEISDNTFNGNFIGVQVVSDSDASGSPDDQYLDITKNSFSDCYYGITVDWNNEVTDDNLECDDWTVDYNDFSGSTKYAIYNKSTTYDGGSSNPDTLTASLNYWGDATGPTYTAATNATITKSNPNGTGDPITDYTTYYPWLYKSKAEVIADSASYQSCTMKLVLGGWNTLSTPVQLIESANAIDELIPSANMEIGYYYDSGWQQIETGKVLSPCDAVYIKMKSGASTAYVLLKFDASAYSWPSKDLAVGWNLISLAYLSSAGKNDALAVASVYNTAAGLPGYSQVISPSLNAAQRDMYYTAGTSWTYSRDETTGGGTNPMYAGLGYWIYMQNAATLAGFEITPIAPDLN